MGVWHCDGRGRLSKACSSSRSAPIAASLRSILYPSNIRTIDKYSWHCCLLAVWDASRERRSARSAPNNTDRQTDRQTFLCIPRQSECSYLFRAELWVEWRCAPTSYQLTVPFFWLTTSRHCAVGPRCFQTIWRPFLQEIKHTDVFLCIAALKMRPICCLETSRTD